MNNHFLSKIKAFLLDLDGTLYLGPNLFPDTLRFLDVLKQKNKRRLFLTNNSFRSTQEYLQKLEKLSFQVCEDEILTSGWATIHYILSKTKWRTIFLLGSPGLCHEFEAAGLRLVYPQFHQGKPDIVPDAVVMGFDQALTYEKFTIASNLLRLDIPYVSTHPDMVCPTEYDPIPDAGAAIEYLAAVTGRRPFVIGKPHAPMVQAALRRTGTAAEETAMVGDRLYTDMKMAREAGLFSVLVLSGETKINDLKDSDLQPDLVLNHVGELADLLTTQQD